MHVAMSLLPAPFAHMVAFELFICSLQGQDHERCERSSPLSGLSNYGSVRTQTNYKQKNKRLRSKRIRDYEEIWIRGTQPDMLEAN